MLGDNIRNIRKSKNISINTLAKISGISLGYLSDLENNKVNNPTLAKLNKIATALDVDVKSLLSEQQVSKALKTMVNINNLLDNLESTKYVNSSIYAIISRFDKEKFTKNEQKEIINYINYIISKRH